MTASPELPFLSKQSIGRDTRLCLSLSARPGNAGSRLHNTLYGLLGLDYVYKSFAPTDLAGAIAGVRALSVRGCAISMPFKEAVIPMLDALEPSALAIDSVNTIVNDDGKLTGYNTDYVAVRDLIERSGLDPATPFVLRGSGGMAKAVTAALRDAGFAQGTIVARNAKAGPALAAQYGFAWSPELPEPGAGLLVNVTPLGMEGAEADTLAFPEAHIAASTLACDVVAQPARTPFIKAAQAAGKSAVTGAQVIVLQAIEQFVLYTGIRPDEDAIAQAVTFVHGPEVARLLKNAV